MNEVLAWVAAHDDLVVTVLSSGLVLAVLGFLARLLTRAWQELHGRGRVVLIRNSRSRLVSWIEDVQERIFPPAECDPRGVLGARIDASRFDLFGRARSDEAMIAIVYLKGRTPVAYLSAEYFQGTGGIFFWYIVSLRDQKFRDAVSDIPLNWDDIASVRDRVSPKLMEKLLRVCSGPRQWKYVVAEVDIEDEERARKKVASFQRAAEELIRRWLENPFKRWQLRKADLHHNDPHVFKVDIDFMMPLHDSDMLHESVAHESPGWLLFAPRSPKQYERDGNYEITGDAVRNDLLKTLLLLGYRDRRNMAYDAYIKDFHERLTGNLPERIRLIHNRNLM